MLWGAGLGLEGTYPATRLPTRSFPQEPWAVPRDPGRADPVVRPGGVRGRVCLSGRGGTFP